MDGGPALGGAFCCCSFIFFVMPGRISSGGTRPLCASILPESAQPRRIFSYPLWSSVAIRVIFRGVGFPHISFFFPFSVSFPCFLSLSFVFFSLSMYLGCWRAHVVPVVSSTMAWHCIVYSPVTALIAMYSRIGVPGGLVGYPRAYQNQLRDFNSHRVHILAGFFSCIKKLNSAKRESVS